jgi:hypothetical protein
MRLSALTTEGGFNNLASIVAANCLQLDVKQLKKWATVEQCKTTRSEGKRTSKPTYGNALWNIGRQGLRGGWWRQLGRGAVACLHAGTAEGWVEGRVWRRKWKGSVSSSLRAQRIQSTHSTCLPALAQLATTTGNRFSGSAKNHVLFCCRERVPTNNSKPVLFKIRGPIF